MFSLITPLLVAPLILKYPASELNNSSPNFKAYAALNVATN